jgi:hypothetical protein
MFASQCAPLVSTTHGGKFATGINDTGSQFSTIFASVVDTGGKVATGVSDTGGKQWEQLSNCWQFKMNLKKFLIELQISSRIFEKNSKRP